MSGFAPRERAGTSAGTPEPRLRLITVGPSLIEQTLRRDGRVELVRTREALEAIGELASEVADASVGKSALLVSDRALEGGEVPQFLAALRLIDPNAPVLLVAEGTQAPGAERATGGAGVQGYDGVLTAGATTDAVREAVERATRDQRPTVSPVSTAMAPVTVTPGAAATASPAVTSGVAVTPTAVASDATNVDGGDALLVQAMLSGRDIVPIAMDLLRRRSAEASLQFVPGATGATGTDAIDVTHRGRVLGTLRVANAGGQVGAEWRQRVSAHMPWLASWLALAEQQATLRRAALTDDLTGAYNRRYFDRYLAAAIEQAHAQRQTLTLLVFDIDNFKGYNDRFGHAAGDEILRETVKLLGSVIRPGDRVCRIGGDEFAVVFYESQGPRDPASKPPESVFQIARRFQNQIREHRFPKLGDLAPGTLTISGGLATYPWDGLSVEGLLQRADELALDSKRSGKNAITIGPGGATSPAAM